MARIPLGDQIAVGKAVANMDSKYGPYTSVQKAFETLGEDGDDVLAVGLTIGVTQQDGSIKEYWLKKKAGENFVATDFVEKNAGGSVKTVNDTAPDANGNVTIPAVDVSKSGLMTPEMLAQLNAVPKSYAVPESSFDPSKLDTDYAQYNEVIVYSNES